MLTVLSIANAAIIFIASLVAIWLGVRKIGTKLQVVTVISSGACKESRISSIILKNMKDTSVSIHAIYIIFNNEAVLTAHRPDSPCVIKPFDTEEFSIMEFSILHLRNSEFKPDFYSRDIKIAVNTGFKIVDCQYSNIPYPETKYDTISVSRSIYGPAVINKDVAYIIDYFYQGNQYIAFISKSGFICREWGFLPNMIGDPLDDHVVKELLERNFERVFTNYVCLKVEDMTATEIFRKKYNPLTDNR